MEITILYDAHAEVGEGPAFDARTGELRWVDILRGQGWRAAAIAAADGTLAAHGAWQEELRVDTHIGAVLPTRDPGELLLVIRDGFVRHDRATGHRIPLAAPLRDRPLVRFNDAKVSPDGRAFATTMPYEAGTDAGELYRLDPDGATPILGDLGLGNGLGWSPDGRTMYVVDSTAHTVYRADYDPTTGAVGEASPFLRLRLAPDAIPDGMCVDDEGGLWLAIMGGGRLERYLPDGTPDRQVLLPVRSPTSVCFAGAGLDTLIVTSLSYRYSAADHAADPHAGAVLAITGLGVTGPAATPWEPATAGL
ncbi:SMP-30/gluconolactonase/LRE family protein [Microbacterium rhizosphaerae]|uniref:Regucalcin n=1 Tax=Microbacterium rhizosphaerae TaxID=1678237 RepID=A0ABZ0SQ09_9MICO|nr:SMP-30/gluconolactonase/LRE family protein [Microbacterium rhizosphaerae]WPR89332.1 SMP-30/gluconolactonase/LRE family protein [Microbacterium rhizosphaerae]